MSNNFSLKRFKCANACHSYETCTGMPLELHRAEKHVDILFLTEYPGKNELMAKQYLSDSSRHGKVFRNVINFLEKEYGTDWSYAIAGLYKGRVQEHTITKKTEKGKPVLLHIITNQKDIKHCAKEVLNTEIEYCDPKLIVSMGEFSFNYIFGHDPKYNLLVENGRLYHDIPVAGEKRDVIPLMHPIWGVRQKDGCAVGFLYEGIRKAVDYVLNGIEYNIPNQFRTTLLTSYDDVKYVLSNMRHSKNIIAIDTEDDNLNKVYDNNLLSLQISNDGLNGYVIPLNHYESPLKNNAKVVKLLHNFFTKAGASTNGYLFVNSKFDYHQLFTNYNVLEFNAPILDCSFAEYTLDENYTRIHGYPMGKGHFSLFTMAYKRGFKYYAESGDKEMRSSLSHLPLDKWTKYGGADVVAPWNIFKSQMLQASRTHYLSEFINMNFKYLQHLIRTTMYCEHTGIAIDFSQLSFLHSHDGVFSKAIKEILNEFYECKTVKDVNDRLIHEKNGVVAKGLFGTSRVFNPSRSTHRNILYFEEMKLAPVEEDDEDEEDDTGTTGRKFQQQYKDAYKEVALLEQFNGLSKMKTAFVNPVYDWMNPKSKNKHPDFQDFRARSNFTYLTVTGRLRSYNPNSQQRPSHSKYTKEILVMYSPPKGRCLVKLDYVTFEVKGLGFISQDKAMVESFNEMHELKNQYRANRRCFYDIGYDTEIKRLKGKKADINKRIKKLSRLSEENQAKEIEAIEKEKESYLKERTDLINDSENRPEKISQKFLKFQTDFHRRSGAIFNSIPVEEVTADMRQKSKGLVFGSIYGRSIQSIAQELKITLDEAKKYYNLFMKSMPQAVAWLEQQKVDGRHNLYIDSPLGRRRRVWGFLREDNSIDSKMERLCMNCISGDSLIATNLGLIPIKELVDKSFNCMVHHVLYPTHGCLYKGRAETVEIRTTNNSLRATKEHYILVKRHGVQMVQVQELYVGDCAIMNDGEEIITFIGNPKVEDVYDILHVEPIHCYVAENFITHNSTIQGICSDCNLMATSMTISLIHAHNRAMYQTTPDKAWFTTNVIHDSCEMEAPVEDMYYILKTFESLYTNLLEFYVEAVFGFKIKVPLEVDFTVGSTYATTEDWDGSDEHARLLQKWILKECGARDKTDYSNLYQSAIQHPFFTKFNNIAETIVQNWIAQTSRLSKDYIKEYLYHA